MTMMEKSFLGLGPHGFHRIVYFEWGDPASDRVLVCVHGLTRRGRDFDVLARALADKYRVICVDLPGRGKSDWLEVPEDYQPAAYVQDMATLIARLDVESVDWLGVSLGGLMGMLLAAQVKTPVRRLILDDIGAHIDAEPLHRISQAVGMDPVFPDIASLEAYMREVNTGYGPLTDSQWAQVAEHAARRDDSGSWRLHYDPRLAEPFRAGFSEPVTLWPVWAAIRCPVLLLRGAASDILTAETAAEMVARKPGTSLAEFEGVGHAPMLMDEEQISIVRAWLTLD